MSPLSPEKEKQLLQQISRGDKAAFATLFYAYNDKLYSFIYRITTAKHLSEDILQDVFFKIWNKREQLQDVNSFSAFLFTVAKHHTLNQLKRMAKETLITQREANARLNANTPEEQLQFKNLKNALKEIIDTLPLQQQKAYRLSRDQHLKQEDIARHMQISVSTVQNHLNRALKTIREKLEKYYLLFVFFASWLMKLMY